MPDKMFKGRYALVINHEEQYSIWPADRDIPDGWKSIGFEGTRDECLGRIEEVWTDMRPSLMRDLMEEDAKLTKKPN